MANTFSYKGIWSEICFTGFDPITCKSNEYERYNRMREEKYREENAQYQMANRIILSTIALLIIALIVSI